MTKAKGIGLIVLLATSVVVNAAIVGGAAGQLVANIVHAMSEN